MNSDTVKPITETTETTRNWQPLTTSASAPTPSRTASQAAPLIPTNLPTTSPTTTPTVTDEPTAAASEARLSGTPALARANNGTTTKLVHGCRVWASRSAAEI